MSDSVKIKDDALSILESVDYSDELWEELKEVARDLQADGVDNLEEFTEKLVGMFGERLREDASAIWHSVTFVVAKTLEGADLRHYLTVASDVKAATASFEEFRKIIVDELGDTILPHLDMLYKRSNEEEDLLSREIVKSLLKRKLEITEAYTASLEEQLKMAKTPFASIFQALSEGIIEAYTMIEEAVATIGQPQSQLSSTYSQHGKEKYDLESVLAKARKVKGKPLTVEEESKFAEMCRELELKETEVKDLEARDPENQAVRVWQEAEDAFQRDYAKAQKRESRRGKVKNVILRIKSIFQ